MPSLELTAEQVIGLVKQLPLQSKYAVLQALSSELKKKPSELDRETQEWMEADLTSELPSYEWRESEIPQGKPVSYVSGVGFVIEGGKEIG